MAAACLAQHVCKASEPAALYLVQQEARAPSSYIVPTAISKLEQIADRTEVLNMAVSAEHVGRLVTVEKKGEVRPEGVHMSYARPLPSIGPALAVCVMCCV